MSSGRIRSTRYRSSSGCSCSAGRRVSGTLDPFGQRLNDPIHVTLAQGGVHRKAEATFVVGRSPRILLGPGSVVPTIIGLAADRDVVHLGKDSTGPEMVIEGQTRARDLSRSGQDPNHVEVIRVIPARLRGQRAQSPLKGSPGERGVVEGGDVPPPRQELLELSQLGTPQSALQVGDSIVESQVFLFVIPRPLIRPLES